MLVSLLPCLPHTLSYPYPPVTPRTCSSVPLSFLAPRVFPCLLVNLSTYPLTLSSITINMSTCLLVNLSTYSLTLSPSYPAIPLSPVTHRNCSSVPLSFLAPRVFPCLLVDLSSALQPTVCSHNVIMSLCLKMTFRHYV